MPNDPVTPITTALGRLSESSLCGFLTARTENRATQLRNKKRISMFFSIGPNSRLDRPINVNGSPFRTGLVACLLVASAVYAFANPATAANGEPQDITDSDPQADRKSVM